MRGPPFHQFSTEGTTRLLRDGWYGLHLGEGGAKQPAAPAPPPSTRGSATKWNELSSF